MKTIWRGSQLVLLLALCLAAACAGGKATPQAKPLSQTELDAMIKKQAVADPELRSQVEFGLTASASGADQVQVTVTNKTSRDIVVGPNCFALIPAGSRQTVRANAAQSIKLFPLVRIRAGEQASGLLLFPLSPIPPGSKVVFIQPPSQPAMALIR